jgi:hypothetical protein
MRCFGPGNFGRQGLGPRKLGGIATYFNRYVLQPKGFEAPGSKGAELDSHTARRKTPTAGLPWHEPLLSSYTNSSDNLQCYPGRPRRIARNAQSPADSALGRAFPGIHGVIFPNPQSAAREGPPAGSASGPVRRGKIDLCTMII